jgi:tRNA modification GTPase
MEYLAEDDIIVALSSPLGNGAIAVIRVSGKECLSVVNPLLKKKIKIQDSRTAFFNEISDASHNQLIDQIVTTFFKSPGSYTGEDVVEISCHCNPLIINRIIEEIIHMGGRVAQPGEFTFRAFMNGKLDLSQAEAVAEIIGARSRQSIRQSVRHLEGKLSQRINKVKDEILGYLSLLEISLDFSEEEIEVLPPGELATKVQATTERIEQLLQTYDYGRFLHEGVKMLILGKPNVGKSSLLNLLIERERAIVSDIPGTTRDYIEASMEIDGLAIQAVDTAGIRKTEDAVEAVGVERALSQLESTDVALCVFEGHRPLNDDDNVLLDIIRSHSETVNFVLVSNKADLGIQSSVEIVLKKMPFPLVKISVKENTNIDQLKAAIKTRLFREQSLESEEIVVTSARHKRVLEKTAESLSHALHSINIGSTEEVIAVDIRLALDCLGEITGETTPEEVLNHIFANFCIGK